ncbi:pyridoxamine 5'-phosphate oxidase [Nocardioides sp. YIM 152588]|uniref:pyridoxamine 5'-phosphate oxidase n=1 Tax=Nocardioides sp. YIM 152588 TaxID=3158259 RepID=UPI0032E4D8A6
MTNDMQPIPPEVEPGADQGVDLAALRREYGAAGLHEDEAGADPVDLFRRWFDDMVAAGVHEPNAMVVATVAADGQPSARTVLLKRFGGDGFVFFTNAASRKGTELADNPRCALLFGWYDVERQVRVEGVAEPLPAEEVAAYFATRPRAAQVGAWASAQSQVVADRGALDVSYAAAQERFAGEEQLPVPPTWGGYLVRPTAFEFWQGRPGRMHDRLRFRRTDAAVGAAGATWLRERLAP